ncbi:hypothetical protein PHPALM_27782 [Phytophthora palmivora]|uniref:PiggyBac transposable element-derived protein domain-containing protein n=1 Tax=Phytophthora palmivora TaxID=4796 RepID=A0A2P4XBS2_9STRA|nr:hypothetical protein PHPALM_27782 [Phytophthora palmivora]
MDIKTVWPLLRKDKWTAKPPTGLNVHFDYIKPGCNRKTGTRGVDYFNGEDALLAYVRNDKDLCARHGISNVVVRSRASEAPARRRQELARFDKVWGGQNATGIMDALDPNLVLDGGNAFLESDGEGRDESDEDSDNDDASDTESSDNELPQGAGLQNEVARLTRLLDSDELKRLHMNVQASSQVFADAQLEDMTDRGWYRLPENATVDIPNDRDVDRMYEGYCGPSEDVIGASKSPIDLFYYFLPKALWRQIASQTNLYWEQTLEARLTEAVEKEAKVTHRRQRSRAKLRRNLMKFEKVLPHEIVQWIGLMLAHALHPCKRFELHWTTQENGVLPLGTFGRVMPRDRFREITRFLHFTDNTAPAAAKDRAWKIRSVLSTLEKTFKEGYVLGSRVAIDEGMLPSHSRRNPTRTYMKAKPHKWGSKVEIDIGRKDDVEGSQSMDTKNGPAAVIRNIACVFRGLPYEGRRLIIADRYYTSIPLAQQLRTMGFKFVGTIQTNRKGWCKLVEWPKKKRPAAVPRGTFRMAVAASDPGLVALGWADNNVVYFLASHVSAERTTVQRREKNGVLSTIPCPALVAEYQRYMGGVDRHDQLRLQSYSLQLSTRFTKYYKNLFVGLVDMAVVNAYIIHKSTRDTEEKNGHYIFLSKLHQQLIEQSEDDFTQTTTASPSKPRRVDKEVPAAVGSEHNLVLTQAKRANEGVSRTRQRGCKVCSYYKPKDKKRGHSSRYFCPTCTVKMEGLIPLCNTVRGYPGNDGLTCSQIWHLVWQNGEFAPQECRIRRRKLHLAR